MWSRGGRSSALDRAQALLSGRTNPKSRSDSWDVTDHDGSRDSAAKTPREAAKPSQPSRRIRFLDLSDLSSASSAGQRSDDSTGLAAASGERVEAGRKTAPQGFMGDGGGEEGGGSRFLKKATPSAATSSHSPSFSRSQQPSALRYVSPTKASSQSAALSRLAMIEDRIRNRQSTQTQRQGQAGDGAMPVETLGYNLGISPLRSPLAPQPRDTPTPPTARSSSELSLKGKRFLKKTVSVAVDSTATTRTVTPKHPDAASLTSAAEMASILGGKRRSAATGLARSGPPPGRVVGGVSLDSDEEDMRRLLGSSADWSEDSVVVHKVGRTALTKPTGKPAGKSKQTISPAPRTASRSSSTREPPRSAPSPVRRGSPLRSSGQRSPSLSVRSASSVPSLPYTSPSPPDRPGTSSGAEDLLRPVSSASDHSEVHSLEELFPLAPGSEEALSERSDASSDDFQIKYMTLDDLVPATVEFTEEAEKEVRGQKKTRSVEQRGQSRAVRRLTPDQQQHEEEEENVPSYESDFESESQSEPISERLAGDRDGKDSVSEVSELRDETPTSNGSRGERDDEYSEDTFSNGSPSHRSESHSHSRSRDPSYSDFSQSDWPSSDTVTLSHQSKRSPKKHLTEAAVQTQPDALAYAWSNGMACLGPAVGMTYVDPTPVASHTVSAEAVEALSSYSPAVFALNDMLRQQLALTRHFIQATQQIHCHQLQSLGPADYTYTTLEDTKEFIHKHKPRKLTMEEALEEVLQEMRDYHYI